MKRKIVILALLLALFIPQTCYAASNPYPKTQTFDGVVSTPCTRVVWQEAHDRLGISLPGWGNAVTWYKSAADAGYKVGSEAKANSIAVYSGFQGYGHVAYVTSVGADSMQVVENRGDGEGKRESSVSKGIGAQRGDLNLLGFIYINEPKASTGAGTQAGSTAGSSGDQAAGSSEVSGDSSLKGLTVEGFTLDFQKDNFYYELSVPYETETLAVGAQAESEKAAVEYDDAPALAVGDNVLEIKVTAEDNSQSIYVLKVTREEEKAASAAADEDAADADKSGGFPYYLIAAGLLIIVAAAALIVVKKKKPQAAKQDGAAAKSQAATKGDEAKGGKGDGQK